MREWQRLGPLLVALGAVRVPPASRVRTGTTLQTCRLHRALAADVEAVLAFAGELGVVPHSDLRLVVGKLLLIDELGHRVAVQATTASLLLRLGVHRLVRVIQRLLAVVLSLQFPGHAVFRRRYPGKL